jgi:cytochrome c
MDAKISRPESAHACVANRATGAMALGVVLALWQPSLSFASGDAAHGATIYHQCMICHSLDNNEIGPRHRDVFGSKAGSVPDYQYSAALKASNIVWNETTPDRWLTNPQALVPGAKMMFSLGDAQDRADVIAFLKERAGSEPLGATVGAK